MLSSRSATERLAIPISFPFALVTLLLSCAVVSVIYSMTGSDEPERWFSEALQGFAMMAGGILALGVVVYGLARWVG
jgi:hypothetical protein